MLYQRKVMRAFQKLFRDEHENLKPEAKIVLEFLCQEAGGRGELGNGTQPYFYDKENRFDANAAIFALGKRRLFDVICAELSLTDKLGLYQLTDDKE